MCVQQLVRLTRNKHNDSNDEDNVWCDVTPEVGQFLLDISKHCVSYQRANVNAPVEPVEVCSHRLLTFTGHLHNALIYNQAGLDLPFPNLV